MEKITSKDKLLGAYSYSELTTARDSVGILPSNINDENFWMVREQCRINDGTYTPIHIDGDDKMRFLHVSIDDPAKVSYTKDADKGRQDLQTRATLAAYCEKFGLEMPPVVPVREDITRSIMDAATGADDVQRQKTIREKLGMIQDLIDKVIADID